MSDFAPPFATMDLPATPPTAFARVLLTFSSPTRAFRQPGLAKSWWLPFALIVLFGFGFSFTVGSRVGWDTVARNNLANSPKREAQMQQLPPETQAAQMGMIAKVTRISAFAAPAVATLIVAAAAAGVLLATLNFGFGGAATFGALFAVYMFSALPQLIKVVLGCIMLFAGVGADTFQINNYLGSNPAYYLEGGTAPHWALSMLSWLDVFAIWQIVLLVIGCAVVAKLSRGKTAVAVCIWVVLLIFASGGIAAIS